MNFTPYVGFFRGSDSLLLTYALLHFVWQGIVITGLLFVASLLLQRQSPRLRYCVSVAVMLSMTACLPANYILLRSAIEPSDHETKSSAVQIVEESDTTVPPLSSALNDSAEAIEAKVVPFQLSLVAKAAPLVAASYATGVLLMTLRLVCSTLGVLRMRALSIAVTELRLTDAVGRLCAAVGLRMQPALRTCERLAVPVVVGILKPAILMPPAVAAGMTADELEAILLHELAHIRRGDLLVNFLQRVAESFLFFHPGVWYVSRLITRQREDCCDDIVLSTCHRQDYASALIRLAESCAGCSAETAPVAALAATGASPSQLKRRVMRILGVASPPTCDRPGFGFLMTCVVTLSIAALNVHARSEQNSGSAEIEQSERAGEDPATAVSTGETATLPDEMSFLGPVQIEHVGDMVILRGARKDVDRLQVIISEIEQTVPKSASIDTEGKSSRSPVQIERKDDGQLIIKGESEQAVEAIEKALRGVESDQPGTAIGADAGQRNLTFRSLQLTEEAELGTLKVALDAYLEGKGIEPNAVRQEVVTNEGKVQLLLACRDEHFEQISEFLMKRRWIANNQSDGDRYSLYYLKHAPARDVEQILKTFFGGEEGNIQVVADERLNSVFVRVSKQWTLELDKVIEQIDRDQGEGEQVVEVVPSTASAKERLDSSLKAGDLPWKDTAVQWTLAFRRTPWSEVLNWIAEQTKSSINQDVVPRGTFSYQDSSRTYSLAEAFDVINEALFRKGYSLIRRNKMIHIVDLEDDANGKLVRDLLAETPQTDLDKRGDFELTKCRFGVSSKDMVRFQVDIQQLLGKYGSLAALPDSKQFLIVDIGRNLRLIRDVIQDHAAIDR